MIAFAGMTHLGLVSAAAAAGQGFDVLCYDPDAELIARLPGALPVEEPGLAELLADTAERITFTADIADLARAEVVCIARDVPTGDDGRSDLAPVRALIEAVQPQLTGTLVILCQVPPGFSRALTVPRERLYYQVETLVFGDAVRRARAPERIILGAADPAAPLPPPFARLLESFGCPLLPMRYESAELAKIAINLCLVASVSTANTLAEICERIGADWAEIAAALRLDRRIGEFAYLKPGLGIAGGNLERDLATVIGLAEAHGTDAGLVRAEVANSRHRKGWAAERLRDLRLEGPLAVWGLTYKENTNSVKNSPSLHTLAQFPDTEFRAHDPAAAGTPANATRHADPMAALEGAGGLLILTPWPQYREIPAREIAAALAGRVVVDPYRVIDPKEAAAAGLDHHTLGRGAEVS